MGAFNSSLGDLNPDKLICEMANSIMNSAFNLYYEYCCSMAPRLGLYIFKQRYLHENTDILFTDICFKNTDIYDNQI